MSARDVVRDGIIKETGVSLATVGADAAIAALTAAGYRILAPGEVDAETVERAGATITKANEKMPSIGTPRMGGDNLAICLCSFFDDGDRSTEDDTGWSAAAREGYEEVTAAIKEHYATAIRSLGRRA